MDEQNVEGSESVVEEQAEPAAPAEPTAPEQPKIPDEPKSAEEPKGPTANKKLVIWGGAALVAPIGFAE